MANTTLFPTGFPTAEPTEDWIFDWSTTAQVVTRETYPDVTFYIYVESCTVDVSDETLLIMAIGIYGMIFTGICCLKACRTFHTYNRRYEEYREKPFYRKIAQFFIDCVRKRNIYIILLMHIWNQAVESLHPPSTIYM